MLSCTEASPPHYNRGRSSHTRQSAFSGGEVSLEASSPPAEAGGDCRRSLNSLKAQEKSPADLSCIIFISCRWSNGSIIICAMLRCMPCLAAPWPLWSELRWWWWRHQLQRAASRQGGALPTPDMRGPALARNNGAEEMEASSTLWGSIHASGISLGCKDKSAAGRPVCPHFVQNKKFDPRPPFCTPGVQSFPQIG